MIYHDIELKENDDEYFKRLRHAAADFAGTNSCVDDETLIGLFYKHRHIFQKIQYEYYDNIKKILKKYDLYEDERID